jgi:hypothetical protein
MVRAGRKAPGLMPRQRAKLVCASRGEERTGNRGWAIAHRAFRVRRVREKFERVTSTLEVKGVGEVGPYARPDATARNLTLTEFNLSSNVNARTIAAAADVFIRALRPQATWKSAIRWDCFQRNDDQTKPFKGAASAAGGVIFCGCEPTRRLWRSSLGRGVCQSS